MRDRSGRFARYQSYARCRGALANADSYFDRVAINLAITTDISERSSRSTTPEVVVPSVSARKSGGDR